MSQTVTFLTMQGNEVIVYLQNEYLPSLNVPPHMIQVKLFFFLLIYVLVAVTQRNGTKYLLCQVMLQQVQEAEIKTLKPYLKVYTKTSFLILSVEFTRAK